MRQSDKQSKSNQSCPTLQTHPNLFSQTTYLNVLLLLTDKYLYRILKLNFKRFTFDQSSTHHRIMTEKQLIITNNKLVVHAVSATCKLGMGREGAASLWVDIPDSTKSMLR